MKERLTDEQLESDYAELLKFIRTHPEIIFEGENTLEAYKKHHHEVKDYEDNPNLCEKCGCNLDWWERDAGMCIPCANPYDEDKLGNCIPSIMG